MEFTKKIYEEDLVEMEQQRDSMESEMVRKILEFNWKTKEESEKLEEMVKNEVG